MSPLIGSGRAQSAEFSAFTQDAIDIVLASVSRAATVKSGRSRARLPQASKSLESTFVSLFNERPADYRRLQPGLLRPKRLSRRYATQLDFTSSDSVAEQAIEKKLIQPLVLDFAALTDLKPDELSSHLDRVLRLRKPPVVAPPPDAAAAVPAVRRAKELHLMIKSVRCVQQVGWEISDWDGIDQILCGGLGFDSLVDIDTLDPGAPSTVHYRKVPKFVVGTFPRNSSTKNYEPHKSFCKWNLQSPGAWPRFFTAFIEMAEQDSTLR